MGVLAVWLLAPPALYMAGAGWSENLHLLLASLAVFWSGVTAVRRAAGPAPGHAG